jgi:DNA-binding response OmpR family regulator
MKIGLLEDNPAILDYMTTALKMAGHDVFTHTQALSLLKTLLPNGEPYHPLPYDLLIVDLLLPGDLHGQKAIELLYQKIPFEELPIIVVSACSQDELTEIQKRFPRISTIRKPFRISVLLRLVEAIKVI